MKNRNRNEPVEKKVIFVGSPVPRYAQWRKVDGNAQLVIRQSFSSPCVILYSFTVRVKVHTLDIAPLRSESPPQKRSCMARVLNGFHSFT